MLSDTNAQLIECYQAIIDDWERVHGHLKVHQKKHSKDYYYKMRSASLQTPITRAARFIYLNRTCWNGLYRVNLKGTFNVPIGTKTQVVQDGDDFEGVANLLQGAVLRVEDFEEAISRAAEGDLVYVDPPSTVKHNDNSFIKYNEVLFSWADQVRLAQALRGAAKRGALIVGSNAYHRNILGLYSDTFHLMKVPRASVISGKSEGRVEIEELLFHNLDDSPTQH